MKWWPKVKKRSLFAHLMVMAALVLMQLVPGQALAQVATVPASPPPAREPLFRVVGWHEREEYLLGEKDWRQYLGPQLYRMSVASRVLTIVGGLVTFSGLVAVLATYASLGDNTSFGQQAIPGPPTNYGPYVYGFSGLTAAGGAMLITGLVLMLPLPSRHRPMVLPRLQVVDPGRL